MSVVRDGTNLGGPASVTANGSFNFDAYGPGTYTITIEATEADNDRPSDLCRRLTRRAFVTVEDDDTVGPTLTVTGNSTFTDAQTVSFNITASDPSGIGAVKVEMWKNGSLYDTLSYVPGNGTLITSCPELLAKFMGQAATRPSFRSPTPTMIGSSIRARRPTSYSFEIVDDDTTGPTLSVIGNATFTDAEPIVQYYRVRSFGDRSGHGRDLEKRHTFEFGDHFSGERHSKGLLHHVTRRDLWTRRLYGDRHNLGSRQRSVG